MSSLPGYDSLLYNTPFRAPLTEEIFRPQIVNRYIENGNLVSINFKKMSLPSKYLDFLKKMLEFGNSNNADEERYFYTNIEYIIYWPIKTQFTNCKISPFWGEMFHGTGLNYVDVFTFYNILHSYFDALDDNIKDLFSTAHDIRENIKKRGGYEIEPLSLPKLDAYFYSLLNNHIMGSLYLDFACLEQDSTMTDDEKCDSLEILGPLVRYYDRGVHGEERWILRLCASAYYRENFKKIEGSDGYPDIESFFSSYNIPSTLVFDKML